MSILPQVCEHADPRPSFRHILGLRLDATSYDRATQSITAWAAQGDSRFVCASTVHMVMEAYDSEPYRHVVNSADLVTPDGMPLVWSLRWLGCKGQARVYGPDLMLEVLEAAAVERIPVGFLGGKPEVLALLVERMTRRFPDLQVAYAVSPPFRTATEAEKQATIEEINQSGTRILFVGLGCPRQERWMAEHRGKIQAVMLGVGAAFDFHAGTTPQAPRWMMRSGLEWLFRLLSEPRRLWKRYLKHNPRFVVLVLLQILRLKSFE